MHKRSTITISTIRGTRVITTHRIFTYIAAMVFTAMIMGLLGGAFLLNHLQKQRQVVQGQYADMRIKYNNVLSFSHSLSEELMDQSTRLLVQSRSRAEVVKKLDLIEELIRKKKANDIFGTLKLISFSPTLEYKRRFDALNNQIYERIHVLYALPSGSPLADDTYISSGYGIRLHPVHGTRQFHHGLDMPLRIGDAVVATAPGTVIFNGRKGGYGKVIIVEHGYGFSTAYGHLDKALVAKGDIVAKGQQIAKGGNSGISTGPHLHYEVRYLGKPLNPYSFYNWNLVNYDGVFASVRSVKWKQIITAILRNSIEPELQLSQQAPL